jgi:uncharacterized protein DUF4157
MPAAPPFSRVSGPSRVLQGFFPAGLPRVLQASRQTGAAVQLPAHLAGFQARVPGQKLPDVVLRKMESFFGADFSNVRVHVGPEAASLGAHAFTIGADLFFAPGQYAPHQPHGQRLLGHELAHVVQQRSGRVRNPFGSGIAVVQDPHMEAEADRMGSRAATWTAPPPSRPAPPAPVKPVPARPVQAARALPAPRLPVPAPRLQVPPSRPATVQPYYQIARTRVFAGGPPPYRVNPPYAYLGRGASFPAQEGSDRDGRDAFLTGRGGGADVQSVTRTTLRVSDDHQMAIEDTDLRDRQPKAFYAAPAVISRGDSGLYAANSRFGIRAAGPRQTLTVVARNGTHELVRVEPYTRANRQALATGEEACNEFAGHVTGHTSEFLEPIISDPTLQNVPRWNYLNYLRFALAQYIAEESSGRQLRTRMDLTSSSALLNSLPADMPGVSRVFNSVGEEYVGALGRRSGRETARRLGINQSAAPGVGDAYVITHIAETDERERIRDVASGRRFTPRFPYHWAGVVAVSGTDRVALENYARSTAPSHSDPRWYFQMYGQGEGQSFHEAYRGDYANAMTMAMRNTTHRRPESSFSWTRAALWGLGILGTAAAGGLGYLAYNRYYS